MASFGEGLFVLMILGVFSPTLQYPSTFDNYVGIEYKYVSNENMENVLKLLKINNSYLLNPVGLVDKLEKNGDKYRYTSTAEGHHEHLIFKLDEEFHYLTIDKRRVISLMEPEYHRLLELQIDREGHMTRITRTFGPENLTIEIEVGNVTATRFHHKESKSNNKKEKPEENQLDNNKSEELSPPLQLEDTDDTVDNYLGIRYQYVSSKNMEIVLRILNVTNRYFINPVGLVDQLKKYGSYYHYLSFGGGHRQEVVFKPGEVFSYKTLEGRRVNSYIFERGPSLMEFQTGKNIHELRISRAFTPENLTVDTVILEGVIGTRFYQKVSTPTKTETLTIKSPKTNKT